MLSAPGAPDLPSLNTEEGPPPRTLQTALQQNRATAGNTRVSSVPSGHSSGVRRNDPGEQTQLSSGANAGFVAGSSLRLGRQAA